jgi:hypothetical protein
MYETEMSMTALTLPLLRRKWRAIQFNNIVAVVVYLF